IEALCNGRPVSRGGLALFRPTAQVCAVPVLLVMSCPGISLVSLRPGIRVLDSFVAAAGSCYEASLVEDPDGAAPVGDDLAVPQVAHRRAHAHSPHAQHERKKFLRN